MTVWVNGERRELTAGATVAEAVQASGAPADGRGVAAAVDGEVVPRARWSEVALEDGQRVEIGRLRPGDELSIAHIRYRLDGGPPNEMTLADPRSDEPTPPDRSISGDLIDAPAKNGHDDSGPDRSQADLAQSQAGEDLAAVVRGALPSGLAEKYRIQVIVRPIAGDTPAPEVPEACPPDSSR